MLMNSVNLADTQQIGRDLAVRLSKIPPPRSISEIRLAEVEVRRLWRWANSLDPINCKNWLWSHNYLNDIGCRRYELFGLILQALIAENGRRKAWDGMIWKSVTSEFAKLETRQLIFGQGQPREEAREALQAAALRFKLRHVYDQADNQAWYMTSYLQFGMTQRSLQSHLPRRLAGFEPLPGALRMLLYGDHAHKSESFIELWSALTAFREGRLPKNETRKCVENSPWIISEWVDDILEGAKRYPNIGSHSSRLEDSEQDASDSIFGTPRLCYVPDRPPYFQVDIAFFTEFDLEIGKYRVTHVNSQEYECLLEFLIGPDGPIALTALQFSLEPESSRPILLIEYLPQDGPPVRVAQEEIRLWDPREYVALFNASGWPLSNQHRLVHAETYILLVAPGAKMQQETQSQRIWSGVTVALMRNASTIQVHDLDGSVVWISNSVRSKEEVIDLSESLHLELVDVEHYCELDRSLTIKIGGLPQEAELTFLQVSGVRCPIEPRSQQQKYIWVRDFRVAPIYIEGKVRAVLRGRIEREPFIARLSVEVPWRGAQVLTNEGWQNLKGGRAILSKLQNTKYKIFMPPAQVAHEGMLPTLFSGWRPVGSAEAKPKMLNGLSGKGESLYACVDRFNIEGNGNVLELARSVIDRGILKSVEKVGGWDDVRIRFDEHVPIDERDFKIRALHKSGHFHIETLTEPEGENLLRIVHDAEPVAWFITFRNEYVGYWWRELPDLMDSDLRHWEIARLLREAKAPLCLKHYQKPLKRFVREHPWSVLETWTVDIQTSIGGMEVTDAAWQSVARQLLIDWRCTKESALSWSNQRLETMQFEVIDLVSELLSIAKNFPILGARLIVGLQDPNTSRHLAKSLCEITDTVRLKEISDRVAVDPYFLENTGKAALLTLRANQTIQGIDRRNILALCEADSKYRSWLAAKLIRELQS